MQYHIIFIFYQNQFYILYSNNTITVFILCLFEIFMRNLNVSSLTKMNKRLFVRECGLQKSSAQTSLVEIKVTLSCNDKWMIKIRSSQLQCNLIKISLINWNSIKVCMVILQKFCTEKWQDAFADIKFKEIPNLVSNCIGNHFIYKTMILTTLMVSCFLMQSELKRCTVNDTKSTTWWLLWQNTQWSRTNIVQEITVISNSH